MHACATDILARSLSLTHTLSLSHTHTRASPLQLLRRNCEYDTKNAAGKEAWERLEAIDAEVMALGGAAFDALIASETLRWGALVRKRGIKMG